MNIVCVLCLFLAVLLAGLLSVVVAYPGHAHLRFGANTPILKKAVKFYFKLKK